MAQLLELYWHKAYALDGVSQLSIACSRLLTHVPLHMNSFLSLLRMIWKPIHACHLNCQVRSRTAGIIIVAQNSNSAWSSVLLKVLPQLLALSSAVWGGTEASGRKAKDCMKNSSVAAEQHEDPFDLDCKYVLCPEH